MVMIRRIPLRAMPWLLCILFAVPVMFGTSGAAPARRAILLEIDDAIGPAVADYTVRGIERAEADGAELVILRIDTPGGLDASMREIIHGILAAGIPVVAWVAPSGSRAASAGTYILYASHVAAMAPATHLGAATPVAIGGGALPGRDGADNEPSSDDEAGDGAGDGAATRGTTAMERKAVNDAVAYIRGLARLRGRNADWAEQAVREAAALTAERALELGVIDLVAVDLDDLLAQLDGRTVRVGNTERLLATAGLVVEIRSPDWRSRLLATLTNPNIAYLLLLLGIYGLFFELYNPGAVVPGVTGAIALLLALYGLSLLPVNYAGLALVGLGIAFMVGEAFVPSFGALGIGGTIAFVIGSLILMRTDVAAFQISRPLVVAVSLASLAFVTLVVSYVVRQRKRPVITGIEALVGSAGVALDDFTGEGRVRVQGELWTARCTQPLHTGDAVRVIGVDGLVLSVEPQRKEG